MAKKNTGYIKVSRDTLHSEIWESGPLSLFDLYLDLNLRANHSDVTKPNGNKLETVHRGQVAGSLRQFSKWWRMSKDTASRKLQLLSEMGLIRVESHTLKETLVTLLNYRAEQDSEGMCRDTNEDTLEDRLKDTLKDSNEDRLKDNYKNVNKNADKNAEKNVKRSPSGWGGDF